MMKIVHDMEQIAAACFTCQKMLSMVLPRKPSLLSEDRSLGPSIVMNSSKSTWPSPVGHTGSSKERQRFRRTHKVAARPQRNHTFTSLFPWQKQSRSLRGRPTDGCALGRGRLPLTSQTGAGFELKSQPREHFLQIEIQTRLASCVYYAFCCSTRPQIEINKHPVE